MLGGALGNFLGPASVADLCTRLAPLPIASRGHRPAGGPQPARRRSAGAAAGARAPDRPPRLPAPRLHSRAERERRGRAPLRDLPRRHRGARTGLRSRPGVRGDVRGIRRRSRGRAAGRRAQGAVRRAGGVQRLHGAGRDTGAAGARPARAFRRRRGRLRRHRRRALLDPAADHRAPAAVPAGRGGARSRARPARRRRGRAADHRRHRAGRPPVVRLPVGPGPPRPRRHGHADVDADREPARRTRRRSRAPDRPRRPWRGRGAGARAGTARSSMRSRPSCAARAPACSRRRWTGCWRASGPPATTSAPGKGWSPRCAGCCCRRCPTSTCAGCRPKICGTRRASSSASWPNARRRSTACTANAWPTR